MGRGGRRVGAGRKPNPLRRLGIRRTDLIRLSPDELRTLKAIARKLALPSPDTSVNQTESNRAIKAEVVR
jgi:hypothetical protein